jgi:ankyrin repeat protein
MSTETADVAVDSDGNTYLHLAAACGSLTYESMQALISMNASAVDMVNKSEGNSPLHIATKSGNVDACRALMESGADPTRRNNKNRTPRSQPKIPDSTKDYLLDVEEEYRKNKELRKEELFGSKIQATQTESALLVRGL